MWCLICRGEHTAHTFSLWAPDGSRQWLGELLPSWRRTCSRCHASEERWGYWKPSDDLQPAQN
jgi:hypothetical protein